MRLAAFLTSLACCPLFSYTSTEGIEASGVEVCMHPPLVHFPLVRGMGLAHLTDGLPSSLYTLQEGYKGQRFAARFSISMAVRIGFSLPTSILLSKHRMRYLPLDARASRSGTRRT